MLSEQYFHLRFGDFDISAVHWFHEKPEEKSKIVDKKCTMVQQTTENKCKKTRQEKEINMKSNEIEIENWFDGTMKQTHSSWAQ